MDRVHSWATPAAILAAVLAAIGFFAFVAVDPVPPQGPETGPPNSALDLAQRETVNAFGDPLRFDDTPIRVWMGDYEYHIPANYFAAHLEPEVKQRGILLRVLLPDFEPRRRRNLDEFRRADDQSRWANFLIIVPKVSKGEGQIQEHFRRNIVQYRLSRVEPYAAEDGEDGLVYHRPTNARENDRRDDVYVAYEGSEPTVIVSCASENRVPSPSCSQLFVSGDLILHLNYKKRFASDWRRIREAAESLLMSFRASLLPEVHRQSYPTSD